MARLRAPGCSVACPQASTPGPACHQVLPPCTVPSFSPLSPVQTPSFVLEATPRAAPVSKQTPLSVVLAPGSWLLAPGRLAWTEPPQRVQHLPSALWSEGQLL